MPLPKPQSDQLSNVMIIVLRFIVFEEILLM